jgi:tetratricopeptide (TPR) repeat protein
MMIKRALPWIPRLAGGVAIATLSAVVHAGEQPANEDARYAALLAQSQRGDFAASTAALGQWTKSQVERVTQNIARRRRPEPDSKAAAMLHTDVAFVLADDGPLSNTHLDRARAYVRLLPETDAFKERWNAYAVGVHLLRRRLGDAQVAVNVGLTDFPKSQAFPTLAGVLKELAAVSSEPRGLPGNPTKLLGASAAYLLVLRQGEYAPARLRLGWVYLVNLSPGHAREQLELVLARTSDADLLYLAHLFLGGVEQEEKHLDAAVDQFKLARSIKPDAQTAHLALIAAMRLAGRIDEARELALAFAAAKSGTPTEDPWWYFRLGFTGSAIADWLRDEASTQ